MKEMPCLPPRGGFHVLQSGNVQRITEGEKKVEDLSLCLDGHLVSNLSLGIAMSSV